MLAAENKILPESLDEIKSTRWLFYNFTFLVLCARQHDWEYLFSR